MKRHQWLGLPFGDGRVYVCERCDLMRERRVIKLRMAISSTPPYDHYKYESKMAYSYNGNSWTFTRPECQATTQSK